MGWDWVHLIRRPLINLSYQPRKGGEYWTLGEMIIGRGNRSTRSKPAPVPLCPSQILHYLIWDRTRAVAVWSRQLATPALSHSNLRLVYFQVCSWICISNSLIYWQFPLRSQRMLCEIRQQLLDYRVVNLAVSPYEIWPLVIRSAKWLLRLRATFFSEYGLNYWTALRDEVTPIDFIMFS
jgi:hypothetical protein